MCQSQKGARDKVKIISNKMIAPDIYEMHLSCKKILHEAKPGQFVNLYCGDGVKLLPRPISICNIDKGRGILTLVYALVGTGTRQLAQLTENDTVEVLGPLGNGFSLDDIARKNVIVAGGVGTPPMVELAKQLKGDNHIFIGFRSDPILVKELEQYGKVYVATDDGKVGFKGNTVELLKEVGIKGDKVYGCGPKPMLKALQQWAEAEGVPGQISLEERMGCGFGACVGCACKIKVNDKEWTHKKVCEDGPVFSIEEVLFQ